MSRIHYDHALLPTGERFAPGLGGTYPDFRGGTMDADGVGYVVSNKPGGRPTRVLASAGFLHNSPRIGDIIIGKHDQTWRSLGKMYVVGIADYDNGTEEGNVPNSRLSLLVYK